MSILADKKKIKSLRSKADIWLFVAIFIALFGRIYENFAHEIYSFKMIYAFAPALIFGCLFRVILAKSHIQFMPGYLANSVYNAGVVTLSIGLVLHGVLQIYGTASKYMTYYYSVGAGLIILSLILFVIGIFIAEDE